LACDEGDEGREGFGEVLAILCKATVSTKSRESALGHQAARQHDEAMVGEIALAIAALNLLMAYSTPEPNPTADAQTTATTPNGKYIGS
jgi:hypothetical protein